ncbi:MAG TPA: DUF5723 family protein [Bacteroidales bacterium]|nr:DUF5723 family protein [Bacteroidales bacterium]HPI67928.1 DUF5723 family protein [Bacteroidales bacterium]
MNVKMKLLLTFLLISGICTEALSQNSQVMYYMNLPQNHFLNPALRPTNKVYIGLPVISGINLNINNNILNFKDVFFEGQPADSIALISEGFDSDRFLSERGDYNFLREEASVQVFGLGFSAGKDMYVFMDYNIREEGNFLFPEDLFRLAFYEEEVLAGNSYDLAGLNIGAQLYNEFGVGFSKNITDRFRIGVKGKLLIGIADMKLTTNRFNAEIADDYSQTWDADMSLDVSGPVTIEWDEEEDMPSEIVFDESRFESPEDIVKNVLSTGNKGFGLDLGALYNITDKLSVSAAVTDLGFISWKEDVTNLQAESDFVFTGENLQDVYEGSANFEDIAEAYIDSMMNSVVFSRTYNQYKTRLSYGITAGGSYKLTKSFSVGLLSHTRYRDNRYHEAFTLSANLNIRNMFSTSIAYTATNYRRNNIGLGLAFRAGWFQIYAMADRIPLSWKHVTDIDGGKIPLPEIWSTAHARLGINLCFGNKEFSGRNDKPMIQIQ